MVWRSLPEPRRLKSGLKLLPVINAMSRRSTSNESARLPPSPEYLKKLPPWINVPEPVLIHHDALKLQVADVRAYQEQEKNLIAVFDKKIKTFLVARGLLSTFPMGGRQMKKIHFVTKDIIHRFPDYITSRTLMMVLIRCRGDQERAILESLSDERVIVSLDWAEDPKPTSVEVLFHDYGLMLATQSGPASDQVIYKGECDACFYRHGQSPLEKMKAQKSLPVGNKGQTSMQSTGPHSGRAGRAAVASFLWKHGNLLEVTIAKDIQCVGAQHAEAVALLSVLKRGREHGIECLDVVTDCEENQKILMGALSPSRSEHPETCMAFIQASKEYKVCNCRWQPREKITHVNNVARAAFESEKWLVQDILDVTSQRFWGMPFVRVNQNRDKAIDKLGRVLVNREKIICASTYYISVPDNEQKADAFEGLVKGMDPNHVVVLVTNYESACRVKYILTGYSCATWRGGTQIGQTDCCSNTSRTAYILLDQCEVPYFCHEKTLVVVYDSLPDAIKYNTCQDMTGVMPVHMVCPKETRPLAGRQVDPLLFGFFHYPGTKGVVIKAKADNSDYTDGYTDEIINVKGVNSGRKTTNSSSPRGKSR